MVARHLSMLSHLLRMVPMTWALLLGSAVALFQVFDATPYLANEWVSLTLNLASAQTILSVLSICIAFWAGARIAETNNTNPLRINAHGEALFPLHVLGVYLVLSAISYLTVFLSVTVFVSLQSIWGQPDLLTIFAAGLSPMAATAVGFAFGSILKRRYLAPVAGFLWWLGDGLMVDSNWRFSGLVPRSLYQESQVSIWNVAANNLISKHLIFFNLGIIVASALFVSFYYSRRLRAAVLGSAALVIVAILPVATTPLEVIANDVRSRGVQESCDSRSAITICIHPAFQQHFPDLWQIVERSLNPVSRVAPVHLSLHQFNPHLSDSVTQFPIELLQSPDELSFVIIQLFVSNGGVNTGPLTFSQAIAACWMLMEADLQEFSTRPLAYTGVLGATETGELSAQRDLAFGNACNQLARLPEHQKESWILRDLPRIQQGVDLWSDIP